MTLAAVTLWLNAAMFAPLGVWLLLQPERLDAWLSLRAHSPSARTELTALYGGLELGIAAFSVYCAIAPARHAVGCAAVLMLVGGIAAARVFGMVRDGSSSPQMLAFLATEIVFVVLAGIAWLRLRS